jgi:outer membrane lipoprotein-sorting protein
MKKSIAITFFLASFLSFSGMTQELNLDEILNKYYQTMGIDKMKEWKTFTATGKFITQGMELPFMNYQKRPDKIRFELEIQGNKMLRVFDGQAGWAVAPWSGSMDPQDMTPDEVKAMKEQTDFEGLLYNWKEKGHKVELIGKEDMQGTPVYKIKAILADGNVETHYIDAENFVTLKVSSVTKIQGNDVESDSYPSNYKEVQGVLMPFAMESKYNGETGERLVIEKYEINTDMNDSLFVKPAKKK